MTASAPVRLLTAADVRRFIPLRPLASHKGKNGHVLLVTGSRGMAGAAVLSALGALKAGAGLVTVAAPASVCKGFSGRLPEVMTIALPETRGGWLAPQAVGAIQAYVRRRTITTLAAGPGLTSHPSIHASIKALLRLKLPMVLDADGLNSVKPKEIAGHLLVITPHPGELSKFLGMSRAKIQQNRTKIATQTAKQLGIVCVLKGHQTVISNGARTFINSTGNPAMATGGMGDVLTGIIAGFLAQGLSLFEAACAGVYVHGLAGDRAAVGDRGLLASDLTMEIPKTLVSILRRRKETAA